jgi:hypothetical protein
MEIVKIVWQKKFYLQERRCATKKAPFMRSGKQTLLKVWINYKIWKRQEQEYLKIWKRSD